MAEREQFSPEEVISEDEIAVPKERPDFSRSKFNRICQMVENLHTFFEGNSDKKPGKQDYQKVTLNLPLLSRGLYNDETYDQALNALTTFTEIRPIDGDNSSKGVKHLDHNWPQICASMNSQNLVRSCTTLRAARCLYLDGVDRHDAAGQEKGLAFIEESQEAIEQIIENLHQIDQKQETDFVPAFRLFLSAHQTDEISMNIANRLQNNATTIERQGNSVQRRNWRPIRFLGKLIDKSDPFSAQWATTCMRNIVQTFGLEPAKTLEAWRASCWQGGTLSGGNPKMTLGTLLGNNLLATVNLEKKRAGIAHVLNQEFGIYDFDRYPNDMMIDQFDKRDEDLPYGIIIYPRDDHNGAFYNIKKYGNSFYHQLPQMGLRVIEGGNRFEIAKRLIQLDRRYGRKNKISFAIIGGHGTQKDIRFGMGAKDSEILHADDLWGKGTQRTGNFFVENPTIILESCSTGTEQGIGHQLSFIFGCRVIAPDVPTWINSIDAKIVDDQLEFDVQYAKEESRKNYVAGVDAAEIKEK